MSAPDLRAFGDDLARTASTFLLAAPTSTSENYTLSRDALVTALARYKMVKESDQNFTAPMDQTEQLNEQSRHIGLLIAAIKDARTSLTNSRIVPAQRIEGALLALPEVK